MGRRKDPSAWRSTPMGARRYAERRAQAQGLSNTTGFDHYVEPNDVFQGYSIGMLPRRENRYGFELRVEVVSCEDMGRCQPGHGASNG